MNDVNWWLVAVAFVLGLALTLAFTIRRVVREVPVYGAAGTSAAAGAVAGAGAAKLVGSRDGGGEEPYGAGSVRVPAGADAPAGYPIKADEDSMLYHTTDSPSYEQTIAEVWFKEGSAAEKAGFTRWDTGGAGLAAADDAATTKLVGGGRGRVERDEPYGAGSLRSATGSADAPAGYTIKGNEDSKLYHSPESPSYEVTIAEVWFRDAATAEAAGFNRWDSGNSRRGRD
jgi:hypothetical protein